MQALLRTFQQTSIYIITILRIRLSLKSIFQRCPIILWVFQMSEIKQKQKSAPALKTDQLDAKLKKLNKQLKLLLESVSSSNLQQIMTSEQALSWKLMRFCFETIEACSSLLHLKYGFSRREGEADQKTADTNTRLLQQFRNGMVVNQQFRTVYRQISQILSLVASHQSRFPGNERRTFPGFTYILSRIQARSGYSLAMLGTRDHRAEVEKFLYSKIRDDMRFIRMQANLAPSRPKIIGQDQREAIQNFHRLNMHEEPQDLLEIFNQPGEDRLLQSVGSGLIVQKVRGQQCWNCISMFTLNQQLQQERKRVLKADLEQLEVYYESVPNYVVGCEASAKMLHNTEDADELSQQICRALNKGVGAIYLGVDPDPRQLEHGQPQAAARKFTVRGVRLRQGIDQTRNRIKQCLVYCLNNILQPEQFAHRIGKHVDQLFRIELVPVVGQRTGDACSKDLFVVKIDINIQHHVSPELAYMKEGFEPKFPAQDEAFDHQTRQWENYLRGAQIYTEIHRRYGQFRRKYGRMKPCYTPTIINVLRNHYNIACCPPEKYELSLSQQNPSTIHNPKQSGNAGKQKQTKLANIFGEDIYKKYAHHSILIAEEKAVGAKLDELFDFLKKYKYEFIELQPYAALPKKSRRKLYYLSHSKKFNIIWKAVMEVDPHRRCFSINETRQTLQLKFRQDLVEAKTCMQTYFPLKFGHSNYDCFSRVSKADQPNSVIEERWFFKFSSEEESIFSFFLLEYQAIRCMFVSIKSEQNPQGY